VNEGMAFWDSSALVPLCVREPASQVVHSYLRKHAPVVWWGSLVEVRSAVARLHRAGHLDDAQTHGALARLRILAAGWKEILPHDELRELAGALLDEHPLRSADSFQLAAALTWCHHRPARRIFVCLDRRLSVAARDAGFSLLQPR
jgi:uncharacterized protein